MKSINFIIAVALLSTGLACGSNSQSSERATSREEAKESLSGDKQAALIAIEAEEEQEAARVKTLDQAVRRSGEHVRVVGAGDENAYVVTNFGVWLLKGRRALRVFDQQGEPQQIEGGASREQKEP